MQRFKKIRLNRGNEKGQSFVEIALITPLMLIALYIPADFGIAFLTAHLTQNAVREGARIGAGLASPFQTNDGNQVRTETLDRLPSALQNSSVTVRFIDGGVEDCMEVVEVTATGGYNYFLYQLVRLAGFSAPNTATITRTTQMRYEYQPNSNNEACTTASVTVP